MKRKIAAVLGIIMVLTFIFGCAQKATTTAPTEPSYAGAMTDSILTAINEGNYANFSRDLDQAMLQAMPEAGFQQLAGQLQNKIGDYVSKQFQTVQVKNDITTVIYTARYTKEANVTITISFQAVSGRNLVAGLYFNAPELQQ